MPKTKTSPRFSFSVKVRSNLMKRILQGVTHPTPHGTSALSLIARRKDEKRKVPASMLLLLGVLEEECGATLKATNVIPCEYIQRRNHYVEKQRDMARELAEDWIPPPPLPVMCEFDLGLDEHYGSRGVRYIRVIFWRLIFSYEGIVRLAYSRSSYAPIDKKVRRANSASGFWRSAHQRQGTQEENGRDEKKTLTSGVQ